MRTKTRKIRLLYSISLILTMVIMIQSPLINTTYAAIYSTSKVSSGGSSYTLYLDLDTTTWTRGETISFATIITVNSFGSGIYDFHEIVIWVKFDNGAGYVNTGSSEWGSIDTVGGSYTVHWTFTPSGATANSFSFYIGSEFWEDVGFGDPYTDDGWTFMTVVSVTDPPAPTINHPADITYDEGDTGKQITWIATHGSPDDYYIYRDDVEVDTGYWSSGVPIVYDITGLPIGDYVFEIDVWDDYYQWTTDTVNVYVRDLTNPIIDSPADISFEDTITGKYVEWIASDDYPNNYQLTRNSVVIDSGSWNIDTQLRFSLDNSEAGTYMYCLTVFDESGNNAVDCVEVTVIGTTKTGSNFLLIAFLSMISFISVSSIFIRRRN